ncbi:MAG TPA: gliding motility-associated C-terminal domain-containing protein [Cyclobacteriaceae bacterium]|nr:gliding motility-associated C-terminal domain-containing protein [Cyclobacteriaceae bacterium]
MKKGILLLFLFITPFLGRASHIVGGEFELVHVSGFQYRLNMILYFDEVYGSQLAKDRSVLVSIFRKADNARMMNVTLPEIFPEILVNYTQPACSRGDLRTSKMLYSALITLSAETFDSPTGYYISWQRCCRNYSIINVFSQDPAVGPLNAGQTFYLEFPPVVKNGQPFVDSTPRLFPPLSDFACPRRPYYTDFGGTDDDGDSLVYSLSEPLSTPFNTAYPPPQNTINTPPLPGPYTQTVIWRPPFSINNILAGAPDLRISTDGFLTVTPTTQGLFVFAVKVEEYRNKIKIGETRRDFQMLVVESCPRAVPPQILGKKLTDPTYTYNKVMNAQFLNSVPDGQRCIQVQVSDADSQSPDDNFIEQVSIKAIPLNFKGNLSGILPTITGMQLNNGSVAEFTICFPQCPYFLGGDPVIGIVAFDDACSLPLSDTLKITLHVEPPLNHPPYFTSVNPVNSPAGTLNEGSQGAWPFVVRDDDSDPLIVSVLTDGFVLATEGMTFNILNQTPGAANGEIKWDARCDIYDFRTRTNFRVTVQVEDQDQCLLPNAAKAIYNLNVILPGNADPNIDTDLTANPKERAVTGLTRRIYDTFTFNVTGTDLADNDYLVLSGKGKDFNLSDYGMVYPSPVNANGQVSDRFDWEIKCNAVDLKKKDTFDFQFIVVDNANKCRLYKADTVDVSVKILPPVNQPPVLSMVNRNTPATLVYGNGLNIVRGQSIDLLFTGTDADTHPVKDNLKLQLTTMDGNVVPEGYSFENMAGTSPLQSAFTWTPDCTIFKDGVYENEYTFTFKLSDDHCLTAKKDSLTLKIKVKDIDGSDTRFIPPNFFSPNGDNVNDYFAMESMDPVTGERKNILPNDNCASSFESVSIVNRWGATVFQSTDRNFRWYGLSESPGVYYYVIKFSEKEYKGSVSLRY